MNPSDNLILAGFMGTGKSTVGREVARRLGRPFIDTDAEIEQRTGRTVPQLFAESGEPAFRELEHDLCRELSLRRGWVIATGGGTLVDPRNREMLARSGPLICLTGSVETILQRVATEGGPVRPLLDTPDPRAAIIRLIEARQPAYRAIPWQIDTTALSVAGVVERVLALAECRTLPVRHPGADYPIHIGMGLLGHLGDVLRAHGLPEGSRIAVVTNPVVAPHYADPAEAALRTAGFLPRICLIPDGEAHKTLETVAGLYTQFLEAGLDRDGIVLALGGGVTGDIAGFAAASYLRGVRFVQVPSTLLAMTDSSVGSKTGVDLPQGKNLVGAFKAPERVLIDPALLATLPPEEFRSGMAEFIKHALIGDPELFAALESEAAGGAEKTGFPRPAELARSIQVKITVVEEDPYEQGRRAVLNLGHTVGHALEKLSNFSLRHGEAVSIGMVAAARIAAALDRADPSLASRLEGLLAAWGLPTTCPPFPAEAILEATAHDKKRSGRGLRWILPRAAGEMEITEAVPLETVRAVLHTLGAR